MKRKGRSEIPDFSKKRKIPQTPGVPDVPKQQHVPNKPVRVDKPPATSMKSGRRGS